MRSVRADDDKWNSGVRRLRDCGQEVRDGGATCRYYWRRPVGGFGEAQREEAGTALVNADVESDVVARFGLRQLDGERRRTGSRGEHNVGHSIADEFVDDDAGEGRTRVDSAIISAIAE